MKSKTIILTSGKCAWGECFGCGWGRIIGPKPSIRKLKEKIDNIFRDIEKENVKEKIEEIKLFTSGSFLDDKQFPKVIRQYFVKKCISNNIKKLIIESRPEFINDENLSDFKGLDLSVAIGLEIANNEILKLYKKGFTVEDFIKASEIIRKNGFKVRTYLMVGLPFVKDLKEEVKKSVEFAKKYSDTIVLINTFPHSNAPIFDLFISGKWKPLDEKQFNEIVKDYPECEKEFNNFSFIPKFHKEKMIKIISAGKEQLIHPYYEVWQDYFQRFYKPPKDKTILLFIPCSYKKPYYLSKLHNAIKSSIKNLKNYEKIHLVVISSPGVIPYEFVNYYPFNSYDWPEWEETKEIKELYIKVTTERILKFLKAHIENYEKIICYFKYDSETYQAIKNVESKLNIKIENCLKKETYEKIKNEKNPLSLKIATNDLREYLEKL
ncbi:MAG: DUF5591 domain-containing protein [Candidatus Aenigmatarchaeota archaeon]